MADDTLLIEHTLFMSLVGHPGTRIMQQRILDELASKETWTDRQMVVQALQNMQSHALTRVVGGNMAAELEHIVAMLQTMGRGELPERFNNPSEATLGNPYKECLNIQLNKIGQQTTPFQHQHTDHPVTHSTVSIECPRLYFILPSFGLYNPALFSNAHPFIPVAPQSPTC